MTPENPIDNALKIFAEGKDSAKEFRYWYNELLKNKEDYNAACTVALQNELLNLQSACVSLYGDIAKISIKDKNVIVKFKKAENCIRDIQKNKYINEINTIFSTQPAVKISLDDYNIFCDARTMIVSLTAQYIKDKLGLLTWGNGWKLNNFNW